MKGLHCRDRRGALPNHWPPQSAPVASFPQVAHSAENLSSITKIKANWFSPGTAQRNNREAADTWRHSGNGWVGRRKKKWPVSLIFQGSLVSPHQTHLLYGIRFSSILIQQIIAGLRTKPRQPDFMTEKFKASGSLGCPKDGEAGRSP